MINRNDYFYKGYDVDNNSWIEKKQMEYFNPYGYNFDSSQKRNKDFLVYKTSQDNIYPIIVKKK